MPKTFWQSLVFTALMATFMVLIMRSYNMLLHLNGVLWFVGWKSFFAELFCALASALLLAGSIAPRIARRLLPNNVSPLIKGVVITFFIASIMVPLMSWFVLGRKFGIDNVSWSMYSQAVMCNFAVAFPVQVLCLGNLVRQIFRRLIGIKYQQRKLFMQLSPYLRNTNAIMTAKFLLAANAVVICLASM